MRVIGRQGLGVATLFILFAGCSVFPSAPLPRDGGAGGAAGAGGGIGGAYTCAALCNKTIKAGCVPPTQSDCVASCQYDYASPPPCAAKAEAVVKCGIQTAKVTCNQLGFAVLNGCESLQNDFDQCIANQQGGGLLKCPPDIECYNYWGGCCIDEQGMPTPHCSTAQACGGHLFLCDGDEDCDGWLCCAAVGSSGGLERSQCRPSCYAGEQEMCSGAVPCQSGKKCVPDTKYKFYGTCQ